MNELERDGAQDFTRQSSDFYPEFELARRTGIDGWSAAREPHEDW